MENIKIPQELLDSMKEFWKFWDNRKAKICKKYGYFISPNTPKEFEEYLLKVYDDRLSKKSIDKKVYEIYKKNNWKSLNFHKKWKSNNHLAKRLPVIKDAISILRKSKKSPHRVILPLLISQINGILLDIAKNNNVSFDFKTNKGDLKSKEDGKIRNDALGKIKQITSDLQDEIAFHIIENILFGAAHTGKKAKIGQVDKQNNKKYEDLEDNKFNFSRHKILHGEDIKGLTKSNLTSELFSKILFPKLKVCFQSFKNYLWRPKV